MEIADGTSAQVAFVKLTDPAIADETGNDLRRHLLAYCKRDTEVMVSLVKWLFHVAEQNQK